MFLLFVASYGSWSAISFPRCPICAFVQLNSILHSCCSSSMTLVLICSMRRVCFFWFCSNWSVIQLSVCTSTDFSPDSVYCIYSNAFRIAICSAWLLVHRPFSLYFNVAVRLLSKKIVIPAPTPRSFLLPSVHACTVQSVSYFHILQLFWRVSVDGSSFPFQFPYHTAFLVIL